MSNSRGLRAQTWTDVLYGSSVCMIAVFMILEFMLHCIHTVRVPALGCTQVDLVVLLCSNTHLCATLTLAGGRVHHPTMTREGEI